MEERNTHQLEEELKLCPDFTKYYEENRNTMKEDALAVLLQRLLDEKDLKRADVIRNSNLNEVYAYQIFQGKRIPDRTKLLGLVFGMKLNFDEAQQLLKSAGYAPLYAKRSFDCIIIYSLVKGYDLMETNDLLYYYGEDLIG